MAGIDVRVQVDGVDNLMRGFQRVTTALGPAMEAMQRRMLERLQTYPPELPNQQYIRTGDLGRAWAVGVDARGTNLYQDRVSVTMRNAVEGPDGRNYAGWVQGARTQARIHQGRWETTEQALEAERPQLLDDIRAAIHSGWEAGR